MAAAAGASMQPLVVEPSGCGSRCGLDHSARLKSVRMATVFAAARRAPANMFAEVPAGVFPEAFVNSGVFADRVCNVRAGSVAPTSDWWIGAL